MSVDCDFEETVNKVQEFDIVNPFYKYEREKMSFVFPLINIFTPTKKM